MTSSHRTTPSQSTSKNEPFSRRLLESIDPTAPLPDATAVLDRVTRLVQNAYRAQWWFLLLDADGVQLPTVPQVEMPRRFGEAEAERIAEIVDGLLDLADAIALVWELPGEPDPADVIGPSMLQAALVRRGRALMAQVMVLRGQRVVLWEPPGPGRDVDGTPSAQPSRRG